MKPSNQIAAKYDFTGNYYVKLILKLRENRPGGYQVIQIRDVFINIFGEILRADFYILKVIVLEI